MPADMMDPGAAMMMHQQRRMNGAMSNEQKLEQMQSYFIEELFLKHIFDPELAVLDDEDEEDMGLVPQGDFDMQNSLMLQAYADKLAQDDVLKLKKMFKKELQRL